MAFVVAMLFSGILYGVTLYLLGQVNNGNTLVKVTTSVHYTVIPIFILGIFSLILCSSYKKCSNTALESNSKTEKNDSAKISEEDSIELISKYKELLDNGIITKEEFETKKNDLLK